MKAKSILTLLLIFGLTNSCGKKTIDYKSIEEHIYVNETGYDITMYGYSAHLDASSLSWIIEPYGKLVFEFDLMSDFEINPQTCDYIVVIFNEQRELLIEREDKFLSLNNKEKKGKRHTIYYHYITNEMYRSAIEK